jgi:DNA replication licensing factor MCM6
VHEAYTLLKSSIIHVEQDDIDFDDPDLDMDMDAAAAATDAAEAADESSNPTNGSLAMPSSPTPYQNGATPQQLASTPQPQSQPQRRKTRITHDKYTTMQELIVLHIASVEQATGTGIEGSELTDWYLETKEDEFGSMEEMEEERELLQKVLKKLVKVRLVLVTITKSKANGLALFRTDI